MIDYDNNDFVLTGIREILTGRYVSYGEMVNIAAVYGISVVKDLKKEFSSFNDMINWMKVRQNEEGYVLRFDNGLMVKVKNDWYVTLHRTFDVVNLLRHYEKYVWEAILNNTEDDLLSILMLNDPRLAESLKQFREDFWLNLKSYCNDVLEFVDEYVAKNGSDARYLYDGSYKLTEIHRSMASYEILVRNGRKKNGLFEHIVTRLKRIYTNKDKRNRYREVIGGILWDDYVR